jgi:Rha family phage regulatory protein
VSKEIQVPETLEMVAREGKPMFSSMQIAQCFGKRHDHVLRAARDLISKIGGGQAVPGGAPNFGGANFGFVEDAYIDGQGKTRPYFLMTKDAMLLLTTGFTGEKALAVRVRLVEIAARYERILAERDAPPPMLPGGDPVAAVQGLVKDLSALREENAALRQRNEQTSRSDELAREIAGLKIENANLRALLANAPTLTEVTALLDVGGKLYGMAKDMKRRVSEANLGRLPGPVSVPSNRSALADSPMMLEIEGAAAFHSKAECPFAADDRRAEHWRRGWAQEKGRMSNESGKESG